MMCTYLCLFWICLELVGVASGYKKSEVLEDYITPMKNKNKKENNDNSGNNSAGTSNVSITHSKPTLVPLIMYLRTILDYLQGNIFFFVF